MILPLTLDHALALGTMLALPEDDYPGDEVVIETIFGFFPDASRDDVVDTLKRFELTCITVSLMA